MGKKFVRFFEHDMIGNFNGTTSNMKLSKCWYFYQKVNNFFRLATVLIYTHLIDLSSSNNLLGSLVDGR